MPESVVGEIQAVTLTIPFEPTFRILNLVAFCCGAADRVRTCDQRVATVDLPL